jgi:DNA-binding IclR family transcriptional regulator
VSKVADAGGGYKMIWENPDPIRENLDASLRFKLLAPDNQHAELEPYMGMLGHAAVRRNDGAVFAHLHPVGTFSMACPAILRRGQTAQALAVAGTPGRVTFRITFGRSGRS